jgi:hypothetical protein
MFRKKSLLSSGAGLIFGGGASGGPPSGYNSEGRSVGGGGWRIRNAGTIMKKSVMAKGRIVSKVGSRQMKVYVARNAKV